MSSTFTIGREAEDEVANLLMLSGFRILHRNWRTPYGEVDLVARKNCDVWIVEVKKRGTQKEGIYHPVNFRQAERLRNAALWIFGRNFERDLKFTFKLALVTSGVIKWTNLPLLYDHC